MVRSKVKIGVLALQGDFAEHISVLDNLNVNCSIVKKPNQLSDINGLIIPGGESTPIKKLIDRYDFNFVNNFLDKGFSKKNYESN